MATGQYVWIFGNDDLVYQILLKVCKTIYAKFSVSFYINTYIIEDDLCKLICP